MKSILKEEKKDRFVEFITKFGDIEEYVSKMATKYAQDGFYIVDVKDFPGYLVITFEELQRLG